MKVIVIESGEYEDRIIQGVATTVEAAARFVRARYGEPHIVKWDAPQGATNGWSMVGHFEKVPGYSVKHKAEFVFSEYELLE